MNRTTLILTGIFLLLLLTTGVGLLTLLYGPSNSPTESEAAPEADEPSPAVLREAVEPAGIREHLQRFATIAERNGGTRAAGTPGYEASAGYVARRLREAGYTVEVQEFGFPADDGEGTTTNVIATSPGGDDERVVMLGAHLDSVAVGPGINDNASGAATILEIAQEIPQLDEPPRNQVRFAFWGAEEVCLRGSNYYVDGLDAEELDDLAVYLNFDMVGSPNYIPFLYGTPEVTEVFEEYFDTRDIETADLDLAGRSDHGPFAAEEVPVGGIFSGDSTTKTRRQAGIYGGEAGEPYDPCYHQACDDRDNINWAAINRISDAAAHATATFAHRDYAPTG
ncbi:MAG: M20/M25/M40 family metallo-hydrolase [Rubrobacteraceae bacterium]